MIAYIIKVLIVWAIIWVVGVFIFDMSVQKMLHIFAIIIFAILVHLLSAIISPYIKKIFQR